MSKVRGSRAMALAALFGGAALTVACGDVTGPPVPGVFILAEADGNPLPVVWSAGEVNEYRLLSDTLVLFEDDTFRQARVMRRRDLFEQTDIVYVERWGGQVENREGVWELVQDICGPESFALCLPAPRVHRVGRELEVSAPGHVVSRLRYVPVDGLAR